MYKFIFLYFCFLLVACKNVHHGYKYETGDQETMKQMVEQKKHINEIINRFGSPTFINSPFDDLICYASIDGRRVPFNRFYKPKYDIVCIKIDENKQAKELVTKYFEDLKEQRISKNSISIKDITNDKYIKAFENDDEKYQQKDKQEQSTKKTNKNE